MLRKIFGTFFIAFTILVTVNSRASAQKKVAVILDAPTGMFSEPEKVYVSIQETLNKILNRPSEYEILPFEDTANYLQIYREENDMVRAVTNGGVAIEAFLKKEDVAKISRYFGSDYTFYIRVSSTIPKISVGVFSASQKVNIIMDFRVWSDDKQDFFYAKRMTATGSSTAVYAGIGSASRAINKGLRKGLKEVEKDSSKIRSAMIG